MPKRTNPFQELVTLIQEALVPVGATVTPSAMVPGKTSGNLREIDVLVETAVGPYSIKIAVEAKDEGRKLDATKIEAIIGKYRGSGGIQVNKIVLIARNGFTPEARTRALDEDVDLMTLNEAKEWPWSRLVSQSFQLKIPPTPAGFNLLPELPKSVLESQWVKEAKFVCLCNGYEYGTPEFLMQQLLFRKLLPNKRLVDKMNGIANNSIAGKAELCFKVRVSNYVLRFNGKDYPADTATMHFRFVHAKGPMTTALYKMEDDAGTQTTVVHSEGIVGGHKIKMLLPLNKPGSRGILKIQAPPQSADG